MKAVHHDLIQQRAYEIWEATGRPQRQDKEHWAQAERELLDAAPHIAGNAAVKFASDIPTEEAPSLSVQQETSVAEAPGDTASRRQRAQEAAPKAQ
jgi:Protein of unknown function (DUF2934)